MDYKIFDLHNDILTETNNPYGLLNSYNNVNIICAIYSGNLTFNKAYNIALDFKSKNYNNYFLGFENIGYKDLDLEKLISLNPKYVSLTYNEENDFGFGCNENKPLKQKGLEVAKILNDNNIVIDTAHLSENGIYSLLNNSNKIINSHSLLKSVYDHKRNLSDEVVKDIVSANGIIGLNFVGFFLTDKQPTIYNVFNHVDYFLSKFGDKNLAFGTDFNGTTSLPKGLENYDDFENLVNLFIKAGYSQSTINNILYSNAKEFFNR